MRNNVFSYSVAVSITVVASPLTEIEQPADEEADNKQTAYDTPSDRTSVAVMGGDGGGRRW